MLTEREKFIIYNQDMLKEVMKSVKESLVIRSSGMKSEQVDYILDQVDKHLDTYVDDAIKYAIEEGE